MRYLIVLLLAGCSSLPSGPDRRMVALPEGSAVWTEAEMATVEENYRALAAEILRLRAAAVPFDNCRLAELLYR